MLEEFAGGRELICRALSARARRRILEALSVGGPMELKEIARRVGLKEVTVRHHLAVMERAGLVTSFESGLGAPGRPKRIYRIDTTKYHDLSFPKRQYLLLSQYMIEELVGTVGEEGARELMRRIGKRIGEELVSEVRSRTGRRRIEPRDVRDHVVPALEEFGSLPSVTLEPDGTLRIKLSNCVFFELARAHPNVVCEGHKALFQTLASAMGDYEAVQETCMAKGADFCLTVIRKRADRVGKDQTA